MTDESSNKEPRVKVRYIGADKRITAITANNVKYPIDPETGVALIPAGAAHAVIVGAPDAYAYDSEKRQERFEAQLEADGTDSASVQLPTSSPQPAVPPHLNADEKRKR